MDQHDVAVVQALLPTLENRQIFASSGRADALRYARSATAKLTEPVEARYFGSCAALNVFKTTPVRGSTTLTSPLTCAKKTYEERKAAVEEKKAAMMEEDDDDDDDGDDDAGDDDADDDEEEAAPAPAKADY